MTSFTPADHVTQREPGPWRDCTFASMLEVIRLGLPGGRDIPPTEAEKERFRAAAGLPDDHTGATIEMTLPAAERLYGLTDEDYLLTRDWSVLKAALADDAKLAVVTGNTAAIPASERITSFRGPHAVAKHGAQIRCDPLGPKGTYQGNRWSLDLWHTFVSGLPGWQALIMVERGAQMISAGGIILTSNKQVRTTGAGDLYLEPGGTRLTSTAAGRVFPYVGSSEGHRAILVRTGIPYPDKVARLTYAFVKNEIAVIEDAPAPPPAPGGDVKHTVTLQIDGYEKYKTSV